MEGGLKAQGRLSVKSERSREVHEVAGVADRGVHEEGQVCEQAEPLEEVRLVHAHCCRAQRSESGPTACCVRLT